jgi:hypothetical protein
MIQRCNNKLNDSEMYNKLNDSEMYNKDDVSGSHGGEYEDGCLLDCCSV